MEKVIKEFLVSKGYEDIEETEQTTKINEWLEWFKGNTKYHKYTVYNGSTYVNCTLKSLNLASQLCNDLSDYIFNEKLEITIDNETVQDKIMKCLEQNKFLENGNLLQQYVYALGTGAYIPYLENGVLKINYNNATTIIPLEWDNQEITSCLFYSKTKIKGGFEWYFNLHQKTETGYTIYNEKIQEIKNKYVKVELADNIREITSPIKTFSIVKTPDVNNQYMGSPYGISIYGNATDNLLATDRAYDSLDNEIALGKKRVYVKAGATKFNTDAEGNIKPIFDSNDVVYYQTPDDEKGEMIKESSFDLRIDEITKALQTQLNLLSKKVGLGNDGLKWENGGVKTATEIISEDSDVYRRLKKQENIITNAITDLCYAIASLIGITEKFNVSVFYDDSIITDTKDTRNQAMLELNGGLISKVQYYQDVYNLGEEEAIEFARKMEAERLLEAQSTQKETPNEPQGEF